jgi:hypothetical protein
MADTEISAMIAVSTRGMTNVFPAPNAAGSADARYALTDLSGTKRRTITGAEIVVQNDHMKVVEATSGTFTLAFAAAATLGDAFWCIIHNSGTGVVTLNPDSSETLNDEHAGAGVFEALAARYRLGWDRSG